MGLFNEFIILFACTAVIYAADLRCYKGSFDDYDVISLDDPLPLLSSTGYQSERKTVFYVFGFGGKANGPSVQGIVNAYLNDTNILLLNWENEARNDTPIYYFTKAIPNARKIGKKFAQTLLDLDEAGLSLSTVHLIGFSLGAQLFAATGREVIDNERSVPRITGLDPAGPGYDTFLSAEAISHSSGDFVDVIHTNPGGLGTVKSIATADFWPNCGSSVQPGCDGDITNANLCSHDLSWKYFAEAKQRPEAFVARSAASCSSWKAGQGSDEVVNMGEEVDTEATGTYYLRTNSTPLYGLSEAGSQPVST